MQYLKVWSPIETYTALYIKHVRTCGYTKSLHSFVNIFGETTTIQQYAKRVMQGFLKSGLICKKSGKREYYWNKSGKYILSEGIHAFVQDCLYTGLNASKMPYIHINKQIRYETQTICEWKLLDRKLTPINRKERAEYIFDVTDMCNR